MCVCEKDRSTYRRKLLEEEQPIDIVLQVAMITGLHLHHLYNKYIHTNSVAFIRW